MKNLILCINLILLSSLQLQAQTDKEKEYIFISAQKKEKLLDEFNKKVFNDLEVVEMDLQLIHHKRLLETLTKNNRLERRNPEYIKAREQYANLGQEEFFQKVKKIKELLEKYRDQKFIPQRIQDIYVNQSAHSKQQLATIKSLKEIKKEALSKAQEFNKSCDSPQSSRQCAQLYAQTQQYKNALDFRSLPNGLLSDEVSSSILKQERYEYLIYIRNNIFQTFMLR